MSTNSRIYLKLKEEDKNKIAKANKDNIKLNIFVFETPTITLDNDYISVYCHWDGYIKGGVGESLFKYHTEYDKILNMLLFGYLSFITYDEIRPYYAWRGEKEEPWEYVKPNLTNDTKLSESYDYLFDYQTNKWYVRCKETNKKWEDLENYIS